MWCVLLCNALVILFENLYYEEYNEEYEFNWDVIIR